MVRITDSMDMNLRKVREIVEDRGAWCTAVHGFAKSPRGLTDWTATSKQLLNLASWLLPISVNTTTIYVLLTKNLGIIKRNSNHFYLCNMSWICLHFTITTTPVQSIIIFLLDAAIASFFSFYVFFLFYFLEVMNIFYWSIVSLQCCVSFLRIAQ